MRNKIFLAVFFLSVLSLQSAALNFPINFYQVDQTYGDYNGIYHDGIDLPGASSTPVISPISSGTVVYFATPSADRGYVCVKDLTTSKVWVFGHITPAPGLVMDGGVGINTVLGAIQVFPHDFSETKKEYDHLHIAISKHDDENCSFTGAEEPLQYFAANITPPQSLSLDSSGIMFWPNDAIGTDATSLANKYDVYAGKKVIWGDTDIIVFGRNNINGGNKSGFYRIDYRIQSQAGGAGVNERTVFTMHGNGNMEPNYWLHPYLYLAPPTSEDNDNKDWDNYYNITNSGPTLLDVNANFAELYSNARFHSWQTRIADYSGGQRQDDDNTQNCATGQVACSRGSLQLTDNDALALENRVSSEDYGTRYPDGKYKVLVKAYTYPLQGVSAVSSPEVTRDILVDNFRPFLKKIEVKDSDNKTKYLREWTLNNGVLTYADPINKPFGNGTYTIKFRFSEEVISPTLSIDTLDPDPVLGNPSEDYKNFTTQFSVREGSSIQDGLRNLTVNGVDLAGNYVLALTPAEKIIDPNLEITRNSSGIMQGNNNGTSNLGDRSVDFLRNFLDSVVV